MRRVMPPTGSPGGKVLLWFSRFSERILAAGYSYISVVISRQANFIEIFKAGKPPYRGEIRAAQKQGEAGQGDDPV